MFSQRLDNASGDDKDEHDDNEVGPPPPAPSDPSIEHRLHEKYNRVLTENKECSV